ncbi:hypothetical protein [Aestuariicoccus sp. MJ-SS9]|uniref:hypothetical protein n=1 Tax=Aestuariicoccus sp. MJ-SS9 TaxID=3079855 RepID=UPI002910E594|nr:hypothetical protein [Aestuariicoccus sp. MJ-SS9]MDU8913198.1 hypothetical protein [Aestuariicoccus sp. MJ-SS9]
MSLLNRHLETPFIFKAFPISAWVAKRRQSAVFDCNAGAFPVSLTYLPGDPALAEM